MGLISSPVITYSKRLHLKVKKEFHFLIKNAPKYIQYTFTQQNKP